MFDPNRYKDVPPPDWMKIDIRPLDEGEFQPYGYGYSRPVSSKELWRPATRYFKRADTARHPGYIEVKLLPGAYYISDHGRIYSAIKKKIITSRRTHKRKGVNLLTIDGKTVKVRRYRLALDNFIEVPAKHKNLIRYLYGTGNHKDGKEWRDSLDNVQYSSNGQNVQHQSRVLHRTGRKKKQSDHETEETA